MASSDVAPARFRARPALVFLLAVLVLLLADRVAGHAVSDTWTLGAKRLAPYRNLIFHRPAANEVERLRRWVDSGDDEGMGTRFDAQLGWRMAPENSGIDAGGARDPLRVRAGSDASVEPQRLALAFGCSFTYGDEVAADETWCAEVERRRPDWRVRNYGVGGYGLDQALLRLEREVPLETPDEVWLALMPSAASRAATHFRGLDHGWSRLIWLKPRVALDAAGELEWHRLPAASAGEVLEIVERPGAFRAALAGDPLLALHGASLAGDGYHPLHGSFAGRVYLTWRKFSDYRPETALADERVDLVGLHAALARRAAEVCAEHGARLRYLVLPSGPDLERLEAAGETPWGALVQRLQAADLEVFDATEVVASIPEARRWRPQGHYRPAVNAAIGAWLAEQLER